MKIHNVEQGTKEWLDLRQQYFTASNLGKWIAGTSRPAEDAKAQRNAIFAKLGEMSMDEEPQPETWAMKRGKRLEPDARDAYSDLTSLKVHEVGFIAHDSDAFGCSPDGLIHSDEIRNPWSHGIELKCPVARTHLKWLFDDVLPDEHVIQVHASMAVTGLDRWDFFAWHPELPPLLKIVQRDDYTEKVLAGLLRLADDYMTHKGKLAAMWKTYNQKTQP